jgi:putative ABC transport system ATP-binding protein
MASKGKPVIKLDGVEKTYHLGETEVRALREVNLSLYPGEYISITGPSGSGKSTLMHIIGALDTPTKGTVHLDGHNVAHLDDDSLSRLRGRKIGFVFQAFNLVPTLNAVENVELPLIFQGVDSETRRARAEELLEKMGLEERKYHRPMQMSGGEQQRVAVARALAPDPDLILADEPTGNLDTKTGGEILKMLEDLHHEGKTIVIVTHEPSYARRAHRRIFIRDGKVEKEEKEK